MFINPNWQTINNERVGVFYIEPYDEVLREEPDRIKVYDSDGTRRSVLDERKSRSIF